MTLVLDQVGRHVGGHIHIENMSLTLEWGSLNALLGPTLSGKTSLMRVARRLKDEIDRTPLHLSGEQQQRTAIARALVKDAQLVLLDEPLANLDYKPRKELREELPKIFGASGAVFVYAATEPTEALLRGNTATLWEGRLAQFGRMHNVYRRLANISSARVFSDTPLNTIPNGKPVDEWGVRMDGGRPVGFSVERGGDTNGPAAAHSVAKYADPQAVGMTVSESGPVPAQGNVAQKIFRYTVFTANIVKNGLLVMNPDGTPKWRMVSSPKGSYWKDGTKLDYRRRVLDPAEVPLGGPPQGGVALRPVHRVEDRQPEEEPRRPDLHPRKQHLGQVLHRARTEGRRPDRVLLLPGARAVDVDRREHPGLSEAGAAVVAEHRRRLLRLRDPAVIHGSTTLILSPPRRRLR